MKTAKEIMSSPVKTLTLDKSITDIIDFFKIHSISGAPVVNEAGFAVGLISRTNLVAATDMADKTAKDLMTPFVFDVTPDRDILEVAKRMTDFKIRRVIVVDDGKPVGVVTALDVVKEYIELSES